MKLPTQTLPVLAMGLLAAAGANASDLKQSSVMTHPSQGPEVVVENATAQMAAVDGGAFVSLKTMGLKPGHVHTLWFVAISNHAACASVPCTGKDVLLNTAEVQGDAGFAGGVIAGEDGSATFAHFQPEGDLVNGWFGTGLGEVSSSEIHLVVKDHGPMIDGRVADMLSTFRDACRTDSISPAFPAAAFADGQEGPNTCALVQHTAFLATKPAS
ncbi:MAG: hypothetical protein AAF871_02720 [Pseudomonadota bacterium]